MDQFINSLPKGVLAFGAIVLGFAFIMLSDPPRTVCDSQMAVFRESQKKFLYPSTADGIAKPAAIKELQERCKQENGPGACFELFEKTKKYAIDLSQIPAHCASAATGEAEIQSSLLKTMKLMVQLAWGERAPASYAQKNGWFDASEIVLFCDLKRNAQRFYGAEKMSEWKTSVLASLPQAEKQNPDQLFNKSLLSAPCDAYR